MVMIFSSDISLLKFLSFLPKIMIINVSGIIEFCLLRYVNL
jgi:hypothetical protein